MVMKEEMKALRSNKIWILTNLPTGKKDSWMQMGLLRQV